MVTEAARQNLEAHIRGECVRSESTCFTTAGRFATAVAP
jgi:hypothetical protein